MQLLTNKGEVYLEPGEEAQVVIYDPVKHPEAPYGLRKSEEHSTAHYFNESQLASNPNRKVPVDIWEVNPADYYSHPDNPRHEELRHCNWRHAPTE